jgi:hypothetical protein
MNPPINEFLICHAETVLNWGRVGACAFDGLEKAVVGLALTGKSSAVRAK